MSNWLAQKKEDSGQALLLVAFLMVVLLGFTALAIDGGRLFFLRRDAQNAADAAVVAGVYALCAGENLQDAVDFAALQNGFENTIEKPDVVTVTNPYDIDGDGLTAKDNDYLQVVIADDINPYFARVVYDGPLSVTVPAVGRCVQAISVSEIGAAFAGGEGCGTGGLNFQGSQFEIIGGMFSNSSVKLNGSSGHVDNVDGDANAVGSVDASNIDWASGSGGYGSADPIPMPTLWNIEDFRPTGPWAEIADQQPAPQNHSYFVWDENRSANSTADNLDEFVRYDTLGLPSASQVTADTLVSAGALHPGIYYSTAPITVSLTGAGSKPWYDATNVTWVSEEGISPAVNSSTILKSYNWDDTTVTLPAPWDEVYNDFPPMPLMFSNAGDRTCTLNANEGITITGSGLTNFYGVFYAPNGQIDVSLASGSGEGSFIAWTVSVSASTFSIEWNPDLIPPIAPWGMLIE